jgi:hypothetical protein
MKTPNPQNRTRFSDVYGLPTMNEDEKQFDRKIGLRWLALVVPKPMSAYSPKELGEKIYARRVASVKFQEQIYLDVAPPPEQAYKRAWQHAEDKLIDDGADKESSTRILQAAMERTPPGVRPNVAEKAFLSTDSGWKTVWAVGAVWRTLPRDDVSPSASTEEKLDHHERQRRFWFVIIDDQNRAVATCARTRSATPAGKADDVQVLQP